MARNLNRKVVPLHGTTSPTELYEGEIGVNTATGSEGVYTKNSSGNIAQIDAPNYIILTQEQYNALSVKEESKIYYVRDGGSAPDPLWPTTSIYYKISEDNTTLYVRATLLDGYTERIMSDDAEASKTGWYGYPDKALITTCVFEEDVTPSSCARLFDGMTNLKTFENFEKLHTSSATSMEFAFQNCSALEELNLTSWNVSRVKNMANMFNFCTSLKSVGEINDWEVSDVTTMDSLFSNCSALVSVGSLKYWNVLNVTSMKNMFTRCFALTSIGKLNNWNTSKVTDMYYMFNNCYALTTLGNLGKWDVSNVTNMNGMFGYCQQLQSVGDLSKWKTSNVTNMSGMFNDCESLEGVGDLSGWDTSNVTDMSAMFEHTESFLPTNLKGVEKWNVANVVKFNHMFNLCGNYTKTIDDTLDLTGWDISKNNGFLYALFHYSCRFKTIDMSTWDMSNVDNINNMFWSAGASVIKFGKNLKEDITNKSTPLNGANDYYFADENTQTAWENIANLGIGHNITVHWQGNDYKKIDGVWTIVTEA